MTIPQSFAEAFTRVKELVDIFKENEARYLSPGYSEAQARLDFIDKFWIARGWANRICFGSVYHKRSCSN